jgi:muramoyltetrapeptide carboxypeptidase
MTELKAPPALQKGARIHVISTARKVSQQELEPFEHYIVKRGYRLTKGKYLFGDYHQFSGTDHERLADLQEALNDPEIHVIWLARGGYGTHRIIKKVVHEKFMRFPKWIVGYSDITVLHAWILARTSYQTLHGTMPINFETQTVDSFDLALQIMQDQPIRYSTKVHALNRMGSAKGRLVGGNLSILYSLTGTDLFEIKEGDILFFEDLDEYLYHVDRMMMNLELSGVLSKISGLIVGSLSDMNDNAIPFGWDAETIVYQSLANYSFPVLFGFSAGHGKQNLPLPLGKQVVLQVDQNGGSIVL